jgi:hypothetical protein
MRRVWKRWLFWLAVPLAAAALLVLACCCYHRVWSWDQFRVYQAMARECDPVWRDLHYGRVQAGDPVEEVIARTRPRRVKRSGGWVVLEYPPDGLCFTGISVAAREGRLVSAYAWSCTWTRQFFDTLSEEGRAEFVRALYE